MILFLAFLSTTVFAPIPAGGEMPPGELPGLLQRLGESHARLEKLYEDGTYVITTRFDELDGKGRPKETRIVVSRAFKTNGTPRKEVLQYLENGEDKTEQRRLADSKKPPKERSEEVPYTSPFKASEQPKYRFELLGADPDDPSLFLIRFTPKKRSEKTYIGQAWIDPDAGAVRKLDFRLSDRPTFVRKHDVVMEFDAETPAGPALSRLEVRGSGGALFIRKSVHVVSTVSDYELP